MKANSWPWTHVGYTYDYSEEAFESLSPTAHVGESEFCIKPGKGYTVAGIYSINYFGSKKYNEIVKKTIISQLKNTFESKELSLEKILQKNANNEQAKKVIALYHQLLYEYQEFDNYITHHPQKDQDSTKEQLLNSVHKAKEKVKEYMSKWLHPKTNESVLDSAG